MEIDENNNSSSIAPIDTRVYPTHSQSSIPNNVNPISQTTISGNILQISSLFLVIFIIISVCI
jgi:hypothetical protein